MAYPLEDCPLCELRFVTDREEAILIAIFLGQHIGIGTSRRTMCASHQEKYLETVDFQTGRRDRPRQQKGGA
jgi:hypothetical protein